SHVLMAVVLIASLLGLSPALGGAATQDTTALPRDDGAVPPGDPGGRGPNQKPGRLDPGPVARFPEAVPGVTTRRARARGCSLSPITTHSTLTLTIARANESGGDPVSYVWENAQVLRNQGTSSSAEFSSHKPGQFTVSVTELVSGYSYRFKVVVHRIRPEQIR